MSILIPETHEAWLGARKNGIGASEAASILGMSKWKSNVELWEEKVGLRQSEDISGKPYVQYGHDAEPHLRALFALDHPELRVTYESPYKMIFSDDLPFLFATPDGELEEIASGRRGGLEIKTTEIMSPRQWDDWKGRIPDQYYCQVCHQMLVTGWDFVWLKTQIKWTTRTGEMRLDTREYHIEREEVLEDIKELKQEEIRFWHHVETKTRPALKLPEI
ncbi:MAG: YqaJ viral recombinase family protein [Oscillospiraceae bacterium]|nr:YqaJ viral recombinase family protein [Oscillospiraceae bacterium]